MARRDFSSHWIFILAAVGSAAGLGNLWRFPYLAYDNGGGAFLFAYIVCLFVLGMTLLIIECGLGQITKSGAPTALTKITGRKLFSIIGWLSVGMTFIVLQYYIVITGWALNYTAETYALPWSSNASEYFFQHFLHLPASINVSGTLVWKIVSAVTVIYLLTYWVTARGTQGIAVIAKWMTPIPFALLFILAIHSSQLAGASKGLDFLFSPDWHALLTVKVWFSAISQVFFSLSIGFGAMIAYGALLNKKYPIRRAALAIVIGDTIAAMLSAVIVFSILGFMASKLNVPVDQVMKNGIGLAFVALPEALSQLPISPQLFSLIFYISIITLAFTSIVSLTEAILGGMSDFEKYSRKLVLSIIFVMCFAGSMVYSQTTGLYILDIVDHVISGYLLTIIVLLELLTFGWVYGAKQFMDNIQEESGLKLGIIFRVVSQFLAPTALFVLLLQQARKDYATPYGGYPESAILFYGGMALLIVFFIAGFGYYHFTRGNKVIALNNDSAAITPSGD